MENKKVAYISMEYAIHQSLKIYSGGLGFLAGSHMRSAYDLKKNMTGIGILYTNGYYDEVRNSDGYMEARFIKKRYSFLKDTGIVFTITIHETPVHVKAYLLPSEIFGTAPLYLLTTDIPENDFVSRSISFNLYDSYQTTRIAQFMLLGIGGVRLLEILNQEPDIYHMNEGHGLPLLFSLYSKFKDLNKVKEKVVFTTHTPEKAGNEEISLELLKEMSFFGEIPLDEIKQFLHIKEDTLNVTLTALKMSKIANGVSKMHEAVSNEMWKGNEGICKITSVTNAQNKKFWMDNELEYFLNSNNDEALINRKLQMKKELFEIIADQTGKLLNENILTIVWARRFAGYKRPDLILKDFKRFMELVTREKKPIQIIWAGKPYPKDFGAIDLFNKIIEITNDIPGCAVLVGYEMKLSSLLKKGADVWLNTPILTREASGTSGMTAAMNGAINFSIPDGWVPEFAVHGKNSFIIPVNPTISYEERDTEENKNLMNMLESEVIHLYYESKDKWTEMMKNSMRDVVPAFDSDRMIKEYYEKLYNS